MTTLNNIKTNKKWMKIFSMSAFAILMSACTQTNAAKIQDLSDSSTPVTTTNLVYDTSTTPTYSQPPANISRSNATNDNYSTTTTQNNGNIITKTKERIVYNRNYDDIPKGGYNGNTYTVNHGDTLFYIAWITGNDFRSLAAKNNVKAPYELTVGQVLDVSGGATVVVTEQTVTKSATTKPTTTTTTTITTSNQTKTPTKSATTTTTSTNGQSTTSSSNVANIVWQWPAKGKIIESFSNATKGIDIAGSLGDKIVAAADGRVVYVGNALPGYGNLIIIKHNDDYLTAYAHNQSFLVKEQQDVKAGQQIATMGNTGTSSVRLHFEVRYKAKSVNPLTFLPKNNTL